jgi:putative transposase
MSERMKDQLVTDALKMALFRRKVRTNLLLHSDRGSQYASDNMQKLLRNNNITCSMSPVAVRTVVA